MILEQLQVTLSRRRFDQLYLQRQIAGHEELLGIHGSYMRAGRDAVGRAVATVAVPSIEAISRFWHLFGWAPRPEPRTAAFEAGAGRDSA